MIITRRNVMRGLFATPAIVAFDNIMPVKLFDIPKENVVWYKGKVTFDAAFVYCPYIPLYT